MRGALGAWSGESNHWTTWEVPDMVLLVYPAVCFVVTEKIYGPKLIRLPEKLFKVLTCFLIIIGGKKYLFEHKINNIKKVL